MKRTFTLALAAAATFAAASPAQAALVSTAGPGVNNCQLTHVSPTATACSGWWLGNLLPEGNGGNAAALKEDARLALAQLGFNWDKVTILQKITPQNTGGVIDFTGVPSGNTIVGIHRGSAGGQTDPYGNATAFFRWNNLDAAQQNDIKLLLQGLSSSTLYVTTFTTVPEPATWLLMIAGVGLVGWQLRRRRQTVKVSYA